MSSEHVQVLLKRSELSPMCKVAPRAAHRTTYSRRWSGGAGWGGGRKHWRADLHAVLYHLNSQLDAVSGAGGVVVLDGGEVRLHGGRQRRTAQLGHTLEPVVVAEQQNARNDGACDACATSRGEGDCVE